jgi:hypothetical protein
MIADRRFNIPQMQKYLDKWYWKHKQVLIFDTFEVRTTDSCAYDVCLWDPTDKSWDKTPGAPVKFMFSIENLHCMMEADFHPAWGTSFKRSKKNLFYTFDSVRAASAPFYFDRCFFLKTWKPLKTEDIERCAIFFIEKVLDMKYRIWNIRVNDHPEVNMQDELKKAEDSSVGRADCDQVGNS